MATLYQLHSTMDTLRRSVEEMSRTWRTGDSIVLLGTTVAFIDWFNVYLDESEIQGVVGIYALANDVAQLTTHISNTNSAKPNLEEKLTGLLSDAEWVNLTQNINVNQNTNIDTAGFDKIVTIAL